MKLKVIVTAFFGSLIFFLACNFNNNENVDFLFETEMHDYQIKFDDDISVDNLLDTLLNIYCEEKTIEKLPYILFDKKLQKFTSDKSKNTIKIGVEPPLCFPAEYNFSKLLEIVKDHNNFEVEGEVVNNGDIDKYVFEHYVDFDSENQLQSVLGKGIWIITSDIESISDVEIIFSEIIDGFIMVADFVSNKIYEKNYNDLNSNELLDVNEYLVFRLSFKHYESDLLLKLLPYKIYE